MEEKKDWKEELQDIINREMFKEDLMIQIKSLVEQELDKAERRGATNERKRLHKEVEDMNMCYDNGIIDNESDDDFIRGQIHNKEHILELLEEEENGKQNAR